MGCFLMKLRFGAVNFRKNHGLLCIIATKKLSMSTKRLTLGLLLCTLVLALHAQLRAPDAFLPHRLGETFTPHHLLVDYFEYVASSSPQVKLIEYGRTNEGRPLLLAFVSSAENIAQLDKLQENQLRSAKLLEGVSNPALDRAFVWLSFSVHGNEAAGSEASMGVLYDLADAANARTQAWLENTVVIIDPSLNPDGYSRYTHWYRGVATTHGDPDPGAREHREPWPGGRTNHYLFDLNRDWAWQTQIESQQRIPHYQRWLPHIHADLHEQYYMNPYYFAPAAQPYHEYITEFQGDFQMEIGQNHARYFDENGWLYFTREVFDLLYPSYGDTYPTFHGSIGMTYEQGGHSRGGRAIIMPNHDTLTLSDRIAHHRTTALSTVEMAATHKDRLVEEFKTYYSQAVENPAGPYKTYVIKHTNSAPRLRAFTELLDKNGIRYGRLEEGATLSAYNYQTGESQSVQVSSRDLVICAYQPLSVLTQTLLDPVTTVVDSLTYDITAWSLPYAYGLEAYASTTRTKPQAGYSFAPYSNNLGANPKPYAYLVPWESVQEARFLGQLLQEDIRVRTASRPFQLRGETYAAGTLVITRADNRKHAAFDTVVKATARAQQIRIRAVTTGFVDKGPDFGSASMLLVDAPTVAMVAGEGTYSNEAGQVWYYFEQQVDYPVRILYPEDLESWTGDDIDVLVLPEGYYGLKESTRTKLRDWVRSGGKLIAIGSALREFAGQSGFGLSRKSYEPQDDDAPHQDHSYSGQERRSIADAVPGAIFAVSVDNTHPLAYGLEETYFSLKTGTAAYAYLDNGWTVGSLPAGARHLGFVGSNAQRRLDNTLVFGVENLGRGAMVYLVDNPLYRGFWANGTFLMSNAVFMVGAE
jgi:hypothetical protein